MRPERPELDDRVSQRRADRGWPLLAQGTCDDRWRLTQKGRVSALQLGLVPHPRSVGIPEESGEVRPQGGPLGTEQVLLGGTDAGQVALRQAILDQVRQREQGGGAGQNELSVEVVIRSDHEPRRHDERRDGTEGERYIRTPAP